MENIQLIKTKAILLDAIMEMVNQVVEHGIVRMEKRLKAYRRFGYEIKNFNNIMLFVIYVNDFSTD